MYSRIFFRRIDALSMGACVFSLLANSVLFAYPTPQQVDTTFLAGTFANLPQSGVGVPFFTSGANGKNQIVIHSLNGLRSLTEQGKPDGILNITANGFYGIEGTLSPDFSHVFYDHFSKKWLIFNATSAVAATFWFALSDHCTITNNTKWAINTFLAPQVPDLNGNGGDTGLNFNSTVVGFDTKAYYFGALLTPSFMAPNNPATFYVLPKQQLLSLGQPNVTAFRNLIDVPTEQATCPSPAINYDKNPRFGYVAAFIRSTAVSNIWDRVYLWRIENADTATPNITRVSIPLPQPVVSPINAPSAGRLYGSASDLDTTVNGVGSLAPVIVRDGHLYLLADILVNGEGSSVTTGDRDAVRLYEWDLKGFDREEGPLTQPSLVQVITIFDRGPFTDNTKFYTIPSLAVNKQGDIVIGGTVSAINDFANGWFAGRLKSDPLGTIGDPVIFTQARHTINYAAVVGFGQRWGDTSSTIVDPCDDTSFWTFQEAAAAPNVPGIFAARIISANNFQKN